MSINFSRHGYLIDMDGVVYCGGEIIPGAAEFVNSLVENSIPFLFLTNNSQRTGRDIATRLQRMGVHAEAENVYTCADATAGYLAQQKPGGTAFVIGEGGLLTALHDHGYSIVEKEPEAAQSGRHPRHLRSSGASRYDGMVSWFLAKF